MKRVFRPPSNCDDDVIVKANTADVFVIKFVVGKIRKVAARALRTPSSRVIAEAE